RAPGRPAALAGAAAVGALAVASLFLSGDAWPWPWPGDETWTAVHRGWLVALAVPVPLLLAAHRDLRGGRRVLASRPGPLARAR
ncbi:hypothetical protein, partial [Spongiactinospora sp. TRM90649]|uniref:hypothetical protein n=1 Tax=Spongiactinospora sp. TRM90649 TaxID=3031114 RepID=UPI0023F69FDD